MAIFGFWNIDSLRDHETDGRRLSKVVADFALERSLDVVFLIECGISFQALLAAFTRGPDYYPVTSGERFKVLARFDSKFMIRLAPVRNLAPDAAPSRGCVTHSGAWS